MEVAAAVSGPSGQFLDGEISVPHTRFDHGAHLVDEGGIGAGGFDRSGVGAGPG